MCTSGATDTNPETQTQTQTPGSGGSRWWLDATKSSIEALTPAATVEPLSTPGTYFIRIAQAALVSGLKLKTETGGPLAIADCRMAADQAYYQPDDQASVYAYRMIAAADLANLKATIQSAWSKAHTNKDPTYTVSFDLGSAAAAAGLADYSSTLISKFYIVGDPTVGADFEYIPGTGGGVSVNSQLLGNVAADNRANPYGGVAVANTGGVYTLGLSALNPISDVTADYNGANHRIFISEGVLNTLGITFPTGTAPPKIALNVQPNQSYTPSPTSGYNGIDILGADLQTLQTQFDAAWATAAANDETTFNVVYALSQTDAYTGFSGIYKQAIITPFDCGIPGYPCFR